MLCKNCDQPITFHYVYGSQGYWVHPDLCDYDCHGTRCTYGDDDEGDEAQPQTKDIR
tara:strand:- start:232 stop:402 length:171 start_codon:yes stop_codon:yes gene_type:complete